MRHHNTSLAAALIALLAAPHLAQAQATQSTWATYTSKFDAYVRDNSIIGASTILVRDRRIVASHLTGFADLALKQRVDSNTIFHYGSITKTLVAVTIMQLRDRGKLSFDDRVTRYIPELRRLDGPADSITIRHLLNHTSGLQNPTWPWKQNKPWEPFEPTTWDQLVAMMPYQQLAFAPGTRYSYSNPAFIYLARVVEIITGEPWLTYVQKNVFAPLDMTRSYFSATLYHLAPYRSINYTITRDSTGRIDTLTTGRDFDPGITNPNGGWNAPLSDVARYLARLIDATRDTILLKPSSLHELFVLSIATTASTADRPEHVGLSFFILPRNNATFIGHTGSQAGFTAFMYFHPATRSGVVAAFNTRNEFASRGAFKELYEASLALLR
jgi:CubicO group peptidase (beta-lactamase class C family)